MKDYRVTVKVRNNRILKAIEAAGGTPGQKWCEAHGLTYTTINSLINLLVSPVKKNGEMTEQARRLCEVVYCLPEDLWSTEQLFPLEVNIAEIEMTHYEVDLLRGPAQQELTKHINLVLGSLSPKEEYVIRQRILEEKTTKEVAEALHVSPGRVNQLENRAMRRLRALYRAPLLGSHLDGPAGDKWARIRRVRIATNSEVL